MGDTKTPPWERDMEQGMNWREIHTASKNQQYPRQIEHCIGKNILFLSSFNQIFQKIRIMFVSNQWRKKLL